MKYYLSDNGVCLKAEAQWEEEWLKQFADGREIRIEFVRYNRTLKIEFSNDKGWTGKIGD